MRRRGIVGLVAFAASLGGCTSLLGDFNVGDASTTDATTDAQPETGGPDVTPDVGKDSPVETGPTCGSVNQQCCPNAVCNQGACCGNQCLDVKGDSNNCGVCGHTCFGESCVNGACQPEKLTQYADTRPGRVRLDQNNAYFITVNANNNGSLYSCSQQGCATPTQLLKNIAYAYDMVLDDSFANVYVSDFNAGNLYWCFTSGCNLVPGIVSTAASGNVAGIAFRGSELYAIIGVQPHEFKIDGTGDVSLGNGNEGANYITAPKTSAYVYWQSLHSVRIAKDNVAQTFGDFWTSTSGENVLQVEGDGPFVAWVAEGQSGTNIYTCGTTSLTCNGNNVISSGNVGYEAGALTVDGPAKMVYWSGVDSSSSHVVIKGCTAAANCSAPITLATIGTTAGKAVAGGVAVNASYVYFTLEDAGTIYLYRVAK